MKYSRDRADVKDYIISSKLAVSYVVAIQMLSADGSRLHFVWTLLSRQASSGAALGVQTKWKASGWPAVHSPRVLDAVGNSPVPSSLENPNAIT